MQTRCSFQGTISKQQHVCYIVSFSLLREIVVKFFVASVQVHRVEERVLPFNMKQIMTDFVQYSEALRQKTVERIHFNRISRV